MKYIPLIIVLGLILAILVLIFYGVSRVKRFYYTGGKKGTGRCRIDPAFSIRNDKDCSAADSF